MMFGGPLVIDTNDTHEVRRSEILHLLIDLLLQGLKELIIVLEGCEKRRGREKRAA